MTLAGVTGDKFQILTDLIGDHDAIIFAIGPSGIGKFQGDFEVGQVLEAYTQAKDKRGRIRVIPALVGAADATLIPAAMRSLWTQFDNSHNGGLPILDAVFQATTGLKYQPQEKAREIRLSTADEVQWNFYSIANRARKNGLTIFVGPYASVDVHGYSGPREFGRELLKRTMERYPASHATQLGLAGELLAHPWVAATASRLWEPSYDEVWSTYCNVIKDDAANVAALPLHRRIADLAQEWQNVRAGTAKSPLSWKGLLLVTAEQNARLERELWTRRVEFGRLRCSTNGFPIYERPKPGASDLAFEEVADFTLSSGADKPVLKTEQLEQILVLKLMDCTNSGDARLPPLSTGQFLKTLRDKVTLPDPLPRHLQTAPFMMLGGGLLNPIVSLIFTTHFLPHFDSWDLEKRPQGQDPVPRFIALHPTPGEADEIRRFEQHTDAQRLKWPSIAFNLERIDWPIPDLMKQLAYYIKNPEAARGTFST